MNDIGTGAGAPPKCLVVQKNEIGMYVNDAATLWKVRPKIRENFLQRYPIGWVGRKVRLKQQCDFGNCATEIAGKTKSIA